MGHRSTPKRPQLDPKTAPGGFQTDPRVTQHRPQIDVKLDQGDGPRRPDGRQRSKWLRRSRYVSLDRRAEVPKEFGALDKPLVRTHVVQSFRNSHVDAHQRTAEAMGGSAKQGPRMIPSSRNSGPGFGVQKMDTCTLCKESPYACCVSCETRKCNRRLVTLLIRCSCPSEFGGEAAWPEKAENGGGIAT